MRQKEFLLLSAAGFVMTTLSFSLLSVPAFATPCSPALFQKIAPKGLHVLSANRAKDRCEIEGTLLTSGQGAAQGEARFRAHFPDQWNAAFIMFGVGGFGGTLTPSANPADMQRADHEGYVTAITDTGHLSTQPVPAVDGSFATPQRGTEATAARVDYAWRATHQVAIALKSMSSSFYQKPIQHAIFDGCSNGGRQGLLEAARFPQDFDGIIAGAPFFTLRLMLGDLKVQQASLRAQEAQLNAQDLSLADSFALHECRPPGQSEKEALDTRSCHPHWAKLACKGEPSTKEARTCLPSAKIDTLQAFFTDTLDPHGALVYPGFLPGYLAVTHALELQFADPQGTPAISSQGWPLHHGPIEYQFDEQVFRFFIPGDPARPFLSPAWSSQGVVPSGSLAAYDEATADATLEDPATVRHYLAHGGHLMLYHGLGDPAISPRSTMALYDAVGASDHMRLFLIPGMGHCGGGAGPRSLDILGSLESWITSGRAPQALTGPDTAPIAASP